MKWVLNTYETAQQWEVDRIIEVCRSAGYTGIEFLQDPQASRRCIVAAKQRLPDLRQPHVLGRCELLPR